MDCTKLRLALAAHLGGLLTPDVAADIVARACAVTSLHDLWPMPPEHVKPERDAPPPWPAARDEDLFAMLGSADALRMVRDISLCSHVYDDLIDRDQEVPNDRVHSMVWKLLVSLPSNQFYAEHEAMLRPVLVAGILNWHAANAMEQSGELEELRIAHAIRYSVADVALVAMCITQGAEFAARNARRMRLALQFDTWAHYQSEHSK